VSAAKHKKARETNQLQAARKQRAQESSPQKAAKASTTTERAHASEGKKQPKDYLSV
jgi:hypothetical protein